MAATFVFFPFVCTTIGMFAKLGFPIRTREMNEATGAGSVGVRAGVDVDTRAGARVGAAVAVEMRVMVGIGGHGRDRG